jgi:hypothetical protein
MSEHSELFRALGVLCEPPGPAHPGVAEALDLPGRPTPGRFLEVFGLQLVPYAAPYVGPEGMLGGEAAQRIAGFWRALGYVPPAEPDHLAALLGLYATLIDAQEGEDDPARRVLLDRARQALLWEHLLTWVPAYAAAVVSLGDPCYADWAALLAEALSAEAADSDPPSLPALHLRAVPAMPSPDDADEGVGDFVRAVLTPVRSGIVLTRRDLMACAREGGLGMRLGERAFLLRSLLEQDPVAVLDWLGERARWWTAQHRAQASLLGPVAAHWQHRSEITAAAVGQRRSRLQEVLVHVAHG